MIETALPLRGTHHLRIHTPPRRWTAAHLEWLARTMASYLPPSKTPEPIDFNMFGFKSNSIELSVRRHKAWRAFRVSCEVSPIGLRPALDDWQTVNGGWGAVLGHEPLTIGPEPLDSAESVPDDDDLDPIEKACRRRLHDDRAIPPSSRKPNTAHAAPHEQPRRKPTTAEDASVGEKLVDIVRLARTDYVSFTVIHNCVVDLLRVGGEGGYQ